MTNTNTNVTMPLEVFISHENLDFMHVSVGTNALNELTDLWTD